MYKGGAREGHPPSSTNVENFNKSREVCEADTIRFVCRLGGLPESTRVHINREVPRFSTLLFIFPISRRSVAGGRGWRAAAWR